MAASPAPRLPRTVFALGLVSFCTDVASEMVLPLLPAFLASLGAGMVGLGLLQGTSDAVLAVLRVASGWLSDRQQRRKPWIVAGYGIAAAARPLMAVAATPLQALGVRAADRVGKGLRSAPRDALLADAVPAELRGAAFGVQRAMDHAGALSGTLLGFLLLWLGLAEREVFAWAAVPGVLGVLVLVLFVSETARPPAPAVETAGEPRGNPAALLPFLAVVFCAAFGAATDLFLIQRALDLGFAAIHAPLLWAVLHIVRSALAAPLGALSDRLGRRRVIAAGCAVQAVVLVLFGLVREPWAWAVWPLFALHGLHAAFTEGAERGFVADLTGAGRRGAVFGVFYAAQGLFALAGAVALGALWDEFGATAALLFAGGASLGAMVLLLTVVPSSRLR
jgi:MFS family permease